MKRIQGNDATRKTVVALGLFKYNERAWTAYKTIFQQVVE